MASLLNDAWRRLRRNYVAMVGLVVVVVVSIVTVLAPVLAPYDPEVDATHVGAVEPGTTVPDVGSANRLSIGEPPVLGWQALDDGTLIITVLETVDTRYRITFSSRRAGRVRSLTGVDGREMDLSALPPLVQELPDGSTRPFQQGQIAVRATAPEAITALAIDHVINLRPATSEVAVVWTATIADGVVSELTRDGAATDATAITAGTSAGVGKRLIFCVVPLWPQ